MSGYFEPEYIEEDYFEEEFMAITPLPPPPLITDLDPVFSQKAGVFLPALVKFALELETFGTAMNNNSTNSTSTTSNTIASSGTVTFTVDTGKSYLPGQTVKAASTLNGTVWMQGEVIAYNPATGVLSIVMNASQGSGTISDWTLSMSTSIANPTGSLTNDFSVQSLTHAIGSAIASAATIDLSSVTGNFVHVTGNTGINAAIMTPGKDVWVIYDGTPILGHHATNHKLNNNGSNITAAVGGMALYTFDGTTVRVIYFAPNGKANQETAPPAGAPIGSFLLFAGSSAPPGYMACPTSQTNISRTTYAALFAVIGTTWGTGDGSTTFGLPWFKADYAMVQANSNVGTTSTGSVKAHTHPYDVYTLANPGTGTGGNSPQSSTTSSTTGSTGGTDNLAAGSRVLICIKYQ